MEALQLYTGCPAISTHYQSLQFNHPLEESPSSENGRAALTENQSLMVTRLVITTRGGGGGRVEQAAAAAAGHTLQHAGETVSSLLAGPHCSHQHHQLLCPARRKNTEPLSPTPSQV